MENKDIKQELADYNLESGIEVEEREGDHDPFDPEQIKISSKVITMDTVLRRIKNNTIRLSPDFQRNSVWDDTKKSQLIESMLLRIPLPMFYVSANEDGDWDVVDGLQRITTIYEYIYPAVFSAESTTKTKAKKLTNLEFWGEKFNGLTLSEFPDKFYNRLMETEFNFTIIEPGTPDVVKINVFKRINTGGMPLTPQEIRHALYNGESTKLLNELVKNEIFRKATCGSVDDTRMGGREIILRALAFLLLDVDYYRASNMEGFLSDTMLILNKVSNVRRRLSRVDISESDLVKIYEKIPNLKEQFLLGVNRAYMIFGDFAFRRSLPGIDYNRTPINKSLFEVWVYILSRLTQYDFEILSKNKERLFDKLDALREDYRYYNSLSRDSWKLQGVRTRFEETISLVDEIIGDVNVK